MEKTKSLKISTIEKAFSSDDRHVIRAAVNACKDYRFEQAHFDKWWKTDNLNYMLGACFLRRSYGYLPTKYLRQIISDSRFSWYDVSYGRQLLLKSYAPKTYVQNSFPPSVYEKYYSPELLKLSVGNIPASGYLIKKWLASDKWYEKCMGLYSVTMLGEYHLIDLKAFLLDIDPDVRDAAIEAIRKMNLSPVTLIKSYQDASTISERICWMRIANGREDFALPVSPNDMDISEIEKMRGIHIDVKMRDAWLVGTEKEKVVALYSLMNDPNVPYVIINRALRDASPFVHETAIILAGENHYPAHREFEPGTPVFKKCIGNVIVFATIPAEAEVRGDPRVEGRSNLALITEVKGDFYGEQLGISFYDAKTQYKKGNFVKIENFDYSMKDAGTTGFHFFSNMKDASKFYY